MNRSVLSLDRLRKEISATWILVVFGVAFAVSQLTMIVIIHPLGGPAFLQLQCFGFVAADYLDAFARWQSAGVMELYRAHLIVDDAHWIWYSVFFTAALARFFEAREMPDRYNFVLVLPLASGLLDWFENRLQHVFLAEPDFSTMVDPLPLLSTLASIMKWLLAVTYVVVIVVLCIRVLAASRQERSADPDVASRS
jgi:hypothetical protein